MKTLLKQSAIAVNKETLRAKAIRAFNSIQRQSVLNGTNKMTLAEINREITQSRKERRERFK